MVTTYFPSPLNRRRIADILSEKHFGGQKIVKKVDGQIPLGKLTGF